MKKLAVFVLVISVISGAVFGQGQEFTFRGLPWGATQEQVIAVLGQPDDQLVVVGMLNYSNIEIAGYNAYLQLTGTSPIFRLQEATYLIRSTDDEVEEIYMDILIKLSDLFGMPKFNNDRTITYWVVARTLIELWYTPSWNLSLPNGTTSRMPGGVTIRYQSPEINRYGNL